jgi:hypothetical protein
VYVCVYIYAYIYNALQSYARARARAHTHTHTHTNTHTRVHGQVWPSGALVQRKLDLLLDRFIVVDQVESNKNNTVSILFRSKSKP